MDGGRDGRQTLLRRLMHKENCHTGQSNGTVQVIFPAGERPGTTPLGDDAGRLHVRRSRVVSGGCQTETQITSLLSSK